MEASAHAASIRHPTAPPARIGRRVGTTHRYFVHRSQREERRALIVLFVFVVTLVGFQYLVMECRKKHDRAYLLVSLVGLWLIPAGCAVYFVFPSVLAVWSLFTVATGHVMYLATRRELAKQTPRQVYKWFSVVTRVCFACGALGYVVVLSEFFAIPRALGLAGYGAPVGAAILGGGLYLGVLTRDCASLCAETMAARMGLGTSRDEEERRELPPTMCCVCAGALVGTAAESESELSQLDPTTMRLENPFAGCLAGTGNEAEPTVALNCGHRYHQSCIRGWALIGKKDTCAYCSERVHVSQVFPWERHSLMWLNLLDAIRYLIVWNPLILLVMEMVLPYIAGRGGGSIGGY